MSLTESLRALRQVNPRSRPGFNESIEEYDELRTQIASTAYAAPRRFSPIVRKRRLISISVVGALLSTAAALAAVIMLNGGSTESAYAAANKAVTAMGAVDSGTIVTTLTRGGFVVRTETTRWNGNDISLECCKGPSEERFVGAEYYERPDPNSRWTRLATDGSDYQKEKLAFARADMGGMTARSIIDATSDLKRIENADGSTTYSGTARADTIIALIQHNADDSITYTGIGNANIGEADTVIGQYQYNTDGSITYTDTAKAGTILPKHNADGSTTVIWPTKAKSASFSDRSIIEPWVKLKGVVAAVELTASNGVLSRCRMSWVHEGKVFVYTKDYKQLGSTPEITAPEGSSVVEDSSVMPKK